MFLQQNLSNYMNALRSSKKQSITEFSEEIGISRSAMQDILKGSCNLRMDTVQYIADRLDVNPSDLLCSPYSDKQMETVLTLLKTIDAFSNVPEPQREKAAALFHELILMMEETSC